MLKNLLPEKGVAHNLQNMQRSVFLSSMFSFIVFPIFTVYLLSKGLSFTTYLAIQALFSLVMLAGELPTGVFADMYGRKKSILTGSVLLSFGFFVYFLGENAVHFAIAELIIGLGISFRSGADRALIYDSMQSSDRRRATKHFGEFWASMALGSMAGSAICSLVLGMAGMQNLFLITSFGIFITVIFEWRYLVEPRRLQSVEKSVRGTYHQIRSSAGFVLCRKSLIWIIGAVILMSEAGRISLHLFQPYLQSNGIDPKYFGVVYFCFLGLMYLGAKSANRLENAFGPVYTISFLGLLYSTALLGMGFFGGIVIALSLPLLIEFSFGALEPVYSAYLNKFIPSAKRATALSFESFLSSAFYVVFAPLMGLVADKLSLNAAFVVLGILAIVSAAMPLAVRKTGKFPRKNHASLAET